MLIQKQVESSVDDASPIQPITSTPKAKRMGWRCQAIIYTNGDLEHHIFIILMDQHMMETTNLSIDNKLKKSSGWQPWSSRKTRVSFRAHIDNRDWQHCGLFVYMSNMMTDNLEELKVI